MLKTFYIIVLAFAFSGCTFDSPDEYNPQLNLMFQPGMYMHIAHDYVERFPTDSDFAVRGWMQPQGSEYLPLSVAHSSEVFVTDTTLRDTAKDTLWVISGHLKWPSTENTLSFLAYSPYSPKVSCDLKNGISYSTDILQDQTDFLYTETIEERHKVKDGWIVPVRFEHALSRIDVAVKHNLPDNEDIIVREIFLERVYSSGTFSSFAQPKWHTDTEVAQLDFFAGTYDAGPTLEPVGRYWFVIPQTLNTIFTVKYFYMNAGGHPVYQERSTKPVRTQLEAGKNYTYEFTIGPEEVKFIQEIIDYKQ